MNKESFRRLSSDDEEIAAQSLDILRRSFPANEQMSDSFWAETLSSLTNGSSYQWYVAYINTKVVGMFFLDVVSVLDSRPGAFLWYLCVSDEHRGDGIGTRIYSEIRRIVLEAGCQDMMFEVDIPDHQGRPESEGFQLAERRIRWYERMGAHLLNGVEWYQEVDNGCDPTEMWLMYDSLDHSTSAETAYARVCLVSGKQLKRSDRVWFD